MPTLWIPDGSTTLATPAAAYAGIRVPSRTTTQIGSLTPSDGSLIYNSTLGRFQHWSGGAVRQWARLDGDSFTGKIQATLTTEQLRLNFDATHYSSFTVASTGALAIGTNGTTALTLDGSQNATFAGRVLFPDNYTTSVLGSVNGGTGSGISFSSNDTYIWRGNVLAVQVSSAGFQVKNDFGVSFCRNGTTQDTYLHSTGTGVLSQVVGTTAQEFQVYGTYTSSTSYSRLFAGRSDGSYHYIGTEGGSSAGPYCGLKLQTSNSSGVATTAMVVDTSQNVTLYQSLFIGNSNTIAQLYNNTLLLGGLYGLTLYQAAGNFTSGLSQQANNWLQFGPVDSASPVAQTIGCQSVNGSSNVTDGNGVPWTFAGSRGTGAGTPGTIVFKTATPRASGTTQQSLVTALTLDGSQNATFAGNVNIPSGNIVLGTTTGSQIGTATTQKLGFWGKAPVVQPQLSTGAAHTVDDVITMLQNLGLCHQ